MAGRKVKRAPRRAGPLEGTILALLGGVLAGAAIAAIHVLVIANLWPDTELATYSAFALLWVATLVGAGVAVWMFRRHAINQRWLTLPTVFLVALVIALPSAMLGAVAPGAVLAWATDAIDAATPLSASLDSLDPAAVPVLGERLTETEVWIALGVQVVLVLALVSLMIRFVLGVARCRSCRSATEFHEGAFRWRADDLVAARRKVELRDWSFFRGPPAQEEQGSELRFDLTTCTGCTSGDSLDVIIEQEGQKNSRLVSGLPLSGDDVRTIHTLT